MAIMNKNVRLCVRACVRVYCYQTHFHWCVALRRSAASRMLRFGFESHQVHGRLSVVSVVCCQVEVSATS